jgi:5-(carboxyamino)imidazole ribonucleotide synthase
MKVDRHRIGILGAGQLALMLAEAGKSLDVEIVCAGQPGDCAEHVAQVVTVDLTDAVGVHAFGATVDTVTIESENIDAAVLEGLKLAPNAQAVGIAQDRLLEKNFFEECAIRVAPFAAVDSAEELRAALKQVGLPAILKTRRMGYDGKGQARIFDVSEAEAAWEAVGGVPCIVEGMLKFDDEVSLIAVRSTTGEKAFYPLTQNFHRDGILRKSVAPFRDGALQALSEKYLSDLLERLDYVGVLAVEFFVQGEELVANEMAPRVHNSGHWTIEGSATSQFENHLRAMLGMKLGSTASKPTVMLNCIGRMPSLDETEEFPEIARHDYGKEPREGRKVGHLTFPASAKAAIAAWERRLGELG